MTQEEKRDRFKRLATQRTNSVIQKIKVLSNCANRSAYSYSEEEVNRIFSEIDKRLRMAKAKFHYSNTEKFSL